MKLAVQERIQHSTDMDTSELSGWYNSGSTMSGGYSGIEEVQDYSKGYYDEPTPWVYPAVGYGDGFELNTVAFGKAKGKGKATGYQGKRIPAIRRQGPKGCSRKGESKKVEKARVENVDSVVSQRKLAEGLIVFTGAALWDTLGNIATRGIPVSDATPRAPLAKYGDTKQRYARKQ